MELQAFEPGPFDHIAHPKKRAYLAAFAETGHVGRSAAAAGISRGLISTTGWRTDEEFQAALEVARQLAATTLEDTARERAQEGLKKYQFTKDGVPMLHPEECVCGHKGTSHLRDESGKRNKGPCVDGSGCDCEGFEGRAYFEHAYSDTLLIFLMKGHIPERYSDRMELRGVLANLDMSKLPDWAVARIAAGENIMGVLTSGAQAPGELIGRPVVPQDVREAAPPGGDAASGGGLDGEE